MILSKLQRMNPRRRRVFVIISAVVIALALAGMYAFWSMNTWNAYKTSYEGWQKSLRTSVDAAAELPVATSDERDRKMTALIGISSTITSAQQSLCSLPSLIKWQYAIAAFKEREEACGRIVETATKFNEKMQSTTRYLENERTLAGVIATAVTASEGRVTEATWDSQVGTWQMAGEAIAKLSSVEGVFASTRASALGKVKGIETAWQSLIAAHQAKDKPKYEEARTALTAAYEALITITTESTAQLAGLTTALQTVYVEAFGAVT